MTIPYCINSIWAKAPKAIVSGKRVKSGLETREVEVIKPQICKKQMSGNLSTKSCPCMICCGAWWTCSNLEFGKRVPCEFQFKSNKSWIAMFFLDRRWPFWHSWCWPNIPNHPFMIHGYGFPRLRRFWYHMLFLSQVRWWSGSLWNLPGLSFPIIQKIWFNKCQIFQLIRLPFRLSTTVSRCHKLAPWENGISGIWISLFSFRVSAFQMLHL